MSQRHHESTVPESLSGHRLDQALARMFPEYSRSRLAGWVKAGEVLVDGDTARARDKVAGGERIVIAAEVAAETAVTPEPIALDVIWSDEHVAVINKPAGLVVHPGAGNADGTLQNGLLHRWPGLAEVPRAGIIHRIDKDTTGLLLIALTIESHMHLTRDLADRRISRQYLAVCQGVLTGGGTISAPIGRHPVHRTRMCVRDDGRPAVTHYRVVRRYAAHTVVRVALETGRTHQIRVHFAHRGYPLVGDPVYGGRLKIPAGCSERCADALRGFRRQALHARRLEFRHPNSGRTMAVEAPVPSDLSRLFAALDPP